MDSGVVRNLQDLLSKAMNVDPHMAHSARALKMQLATQLSGKIIPTSSPPFVKASESA
jgi:hypothetical protein